ncbi:hypothetical protein GCM10009619_41230 [Williamsia maris]
MRLTVTMALASPRGATSANMTSSGAGRGVRFQPGGRATATDKRAIGVATDTIDTPGTPGRQINPSIVCGDGSRLEVILVADVSAPGGPAPR